MESRSRGLQPIVDGLAARIGRNVAIDDPQIHLLAYSAQVGRTDEQRVQSIMQKQVDESLVTHAYRHGIATAEHPVRVEGIPELGFLERVCIPVRSQGLLLGFLWIIDHDHTLADEALTWSVEAAAAAGEVLIGERFLDDELRARQAELLTNLISDDDETRTRAYSDGLAAQHFAESEACRCIVIADSGSGAALDYLLRNVSRRIAPLPAMSAVLHGAEGVLLLHGSASAVERQVRGSALFQNVASKDGSRPRIGIGSLEPSVAQAVSSYRRARLAAAVGGHLDSSAQVTVWDDLGVYQSLAQLPGVETGDAPLLPEIQLLLADKNAHQMVETLETYLDLAGSVQHCVERLHLHRTSLYYRLTRIEQLTGCTLANGEHRLMLHLGLKIARLQGRLPGQDRAVPPSK